MNEKKAIALPPKLQEWVDARKRHRLADAHIQMARELGFLPNSLRKIDDNKQKLWKAPLPVYLEDLYFKKFGRDRPEVVRSIEQIAADWQANEARKKAAKVARRLERASQQDVPNVDGDAESPRSTAPSEVQTLTEPTVQALPEGELNEF